MAWPKRSATPKLNSILNNTGCREELVKGWLGTISTSNQTPAGKNRLAYVARENPEQRPEEGSLGDINMPHF